MANINDSGRESASASDVITRHASAASSSINGPAPPPSSYLQNLHHHQPSYARPPDSPRNRLSITPEIHDSPKSHTGRHLTTSVGSERSILPTYRRSTDMRGRKLKSQYPVDAGKEHVEFILVASFDIDKGAVMEHQYPTSISGDEQMLADLMLPDQMHERKEDWTIFFLHKDTSAEPEPDEVVQASRRRREEQIANAKLTGEEGGGHAEGGDDKRQSLNFDMNDDDEMEAIEGPPLVYVLNLVNTKHDQSVKRGAVVKAMAICTRHSFLHIYKPLLLLALDAYFRIPTMDTLAALYNAVNSMDLSLMPSLNVLERIILQASNAKDLFIEKFQRMVDQQKTDGLGLGLIASTGPSSDAPMLRSDSSQGAGPRGLLPRDTHEFESRVYYNGITVPIKVPTARSAETVGDFSIIKLISTFSGPHSSSPTPFPHHPHLTTGGPLTHPIIVLVNALLTQKRVMFLGHKRPSGEVAEAVLAACALASGGLLRGFTRHAFPYTDLTKIDDLQKVPGFIAGVTNPRFANRPDWWDLLCDLPTGRMRISSQIAHAEFSPGLQSFAQQNPVFALSSTSAPSSSSSSAANDPTNDAAFMDAVQRAITNRLGEAAVRRMWADWIARFTRQAAAYEEAVYGTSALYIGGERCDAGAYGVAGHGYVWPDEASRARELAANAHRIDAWRNTRAYYSLVQHVALLYDARPIAALDLLHHHDRLRSLRLSQDDSAAIYLAFARAVRSEADICQLLTVTQEAHAGLFYLSLGLLHPRPDVRRATAALLDRVRGHDAGKHFWGSLGRFAKVAHARISREMQAQRGGGGDEGDAAGGDAGVGLGQTALPDRSVGGVGVDAGVR